MDVVVRRATADDVGALARLNQIVQALHVSAEPAAFRADSSDAEMQSFFANLVIADKTFVLIAELAGLPVGYAWFEIQDRPPTPFTNARLRIYIHHVVVCENSRKLGVGSSLLDAAEAEAQVRGIKDVVLDTWAFNESARNFFEAADFKPFNIFMRKKLGNSA